MHIYSQEKKFYVYQYSRKNESENGLVNSPYYIGKGFGRRYNERHSVGISVPTQKQNIQFIAEHLNEADAFQLEMLLIQMYGRIDLGTGCLHNRTNGGEGMSGFQCSLETRKKMSVSRRGKPSHRKGKTMSAEAKKKISASLIGNTRSVGRIHSAETRKKISTGNKGKLRSEETKQRIRDNHVGTTGKSLRRKPKESPYSSE